MHPSQKDGNLPESQKAKHRFVFHEDEKHRHGFDLLESEKFRHDRVERTYQIFVCEKRVVGWETIEWQSRVIIALCTFDAIT